MLVLLFHLFCLFSNSARAESNRSLSASELANRQKFVRDMQKEVTRCKETLSSGKVQSLLDRERNLDVCCVLVVSLFSHFRLLICLYRFVQRDRQRDASGRFSGLDREAKHELGDWVAETQGHQNVCLSLFFLSASRFKFCLLFAL